MYWQEVFKMIITGQNPRTNRGMKVVGILTRYDFQ
jgi:hypothetical protein